MEPGDPPRSTRGRIFVKEYLNENTLFTTVKMYIEESSQLLLVVEGDDDHLVLKEHCTNDLRLIAGIGGREQVLRSAALASSQNLRGVRFLVDRDYENFKASKCSYPENVCLSTGHDMFMDLLANDPKLLRRVIDVHTAGARRRPVKKENSLPPIPEPLTIAEEALTLAAHLAAVRIVDARRNLNLDFKRFSFGSLKVSEFDTYVIANEIMVRCEQNVDLAVEVVSECVLVHHEIRGQHAFVVGDHDFFSALARVLKCFQISISDEFLQKAFIMGVSCTSVAAGGWFDEIQSWCALNSRTGFDCTIAA